jgi:phosphatidylserine decarboxylase
MWARHYVYKGWARAFNSNLEEMSRPLEDYTSLREFFTRELKEGVRPLASGPACLVTGNH